MELTLDLLSAISTAFAAFFWLRSATVKYPDKPQPTFTITDKGNKRMNDVDSFFHSQNLYFQDKYKAIQQQSKYNSRAAAFATIAATVQILLLIFKYYQKMV